MTAEMRLIGSPSELSGIEDAVKPVLKLSGCLRYPSRRSGDELRYYRASPQESRPETKIRVRRVSDLNFQLEDLDGKNHVLVMADFAAPGYVSQGIAAALNEEIQNAIRDIIHSGINDVYLRLDQTRKPSGIALYHSGNEWMTIPYEGAFDWEDARDYGGDD